MLHFVCSLNGTHFMERTWLITKTTITLLFIAIIFLVLVNKLYAMGQVRGWIKGAVTQTHGITDKRKLEGMIDEAYWVAWSKSDITVPSANRINLFEEQWHLLQVGDEIAILKIPDDPIPYYKDGIYASTGNFILDFVLITLLLWWAKRVINRFQLEYSELE